MEPLVTLRVTNGSPENPSEDGSHSYETPNSGSSHGTHAAIGHSQVTNGLDEGQEYLAPPRPGGDPGPGAPDLLRTVLRSKGAARRGRVLLPVR